MVVEGNSGAMDLPAWQARLAQFAADRQWQPYLTPKNIAMAMSVEAAEVVELYQWLTPEQSPDPTALGDELADVLLYLLQLAQAAGIDLEAATEAKLAKNALKYPAP